MLRTEVLLFRIDRGVTWTNLLKVNAIVGAVLIANFFVKYMQTGQFAEELMLLQFVVGLAGLLLVYGLMA